MSSDLALYVLIYLADVNPSTGASSHSKFDGGEGRGKGVEGKGGGGDEGEEGGGGKKK
jgi:hypothetical protein